MNITETEKKLLAAALGARERAYSPYSLISVGCAILTDKGNIITGANIENSAFSPTLCAERVALAATVMQGERPVMLAVVGGRLNAVPSDIFPPCGVCRQMLSEFADDDMPILLGTPDSARRVTLGELLPLSFGKENFK